MRSAATSRRCPVARRSTSRVADSGQIVACQSLEWYSTVLTTMSHVAQVGTFVLPSWRGRGVGPALFELTRRFAVSAGYRKAVITVRGSNASALSFYRGLGFIECGRLSKQVVLDGVEDDEVLLEMFLFRHVADARECDGAKVRRSSPKVRRSGTVGTGASGPDLRTVAPSPPRTVLRQYPACLIAPDRHAFKESLVVDLATERRQFFAPGAAPPEILELFRERHVDSQRGETAIEIRLVAMLAKACGKRRGAAHADSPFRLAIGNRLEMPVVREQGRRRTWLPSEARPDNHPRHRPRAQASQGSRPAARRISRSPQPRS